LSGAYVYESMAVTGTSKKSSKSFSTVTHGTDSTGGLGNREGRGNVTLDDFT
jgi:hypothetical protein